MLELPELLCQTGALLEGHFVLSSGLHSDRYIQCARLLQHPQLAEQLASQLAQKLGAQLLDSPRPIDAVIGPALGGVIVAYEVARALGVRALYAERENGVLTLRRGFTLTAGERVLIVEDVVTTGRSARETAQIVKHHGGTVAGYGALLARSDSHGLEPFCALWQLRPRIFSQTDCPLCQSGAPLSRPGSRTSLETGMRSSHANDTQ